MKKKRLLILLKALVSASLIWLLYRRIDMHALGDRLLGVAILPLVLFELILLANSFVSSVKWWLFLRADGYRPPLLGLFGSYLVASFFTVFLPSTIGGDAYRLYDFQRRGVKGGHLAASIFADRFTGFLALAALGFLFPIIGLRWIPQPLVLLVPFAFFAALLVMGGCLIRQTLLRRLLALTRLDRAAALMRFLNRFLDSVGVYRRRPGLLARAMGLSFLFQVGVIAAIYCIGGALRLPIRFLMYCVFVPIVSLLEAIPISIFGIGLRDSGYLLFFRQFGRPAEEAAALSILYVSATLVYVLLGGALFLLRKAPPPDADASPTAPPYENV